jgi:hypothetical protein
MSAKQIYFEVVNFCKENNYKVKIDLINNYVICSGLEHDISQIHARFGGKINSKNLVI